MNSGNHVMLLGDLVVCITNTWPVFKNTTGNFKHITTKPYPMDGLESVKASYHSAKGIKFVKMEGAYVCTK